MGNLFSKVKESEPLEPEVLVETAIDIKPNSSTCGEAGPSSDVGPRQRNYTCSKCNRRLPRTSLRPFGDGDMFVCRSCRRTEILKDERDKTSKRAELEGHLDVSLSSPFITDPGETSSDSSNSDLQEGSNSEDSTPAKRPKISLNISRCPGVRNRCVFCKSKKLTRRGDLQLVSIPRKAKSKIFIDAGILLPQNARCCKRHLQGGFVLEEAVESCIVTSHTAELCAPEIEAIIYDLRQTARRRNLDFDTAQALSNNDFHALTGLNESDFNTLYSYVSNQLRSTKGRSPRTCLAIFLMKLRTGVSHSVLSALFGLPRKTIGRTIQTVRRLLLFSFVPGNLGVNHISREDFIDHHTSPMAKAIFSPNESRAILVADATYVYIQKSSNYNFQRRTYSVHKGRPLIKPMIIVSSTGYFLDIFGPYFTDGRNNDAGILTAIMRAQQSRLKAWLREGDIFVVDRGFRDCLQTLQEVGFDTKMPAFLEKGSQHSTQEANDSRLVTAVRWIVEASYGLLKTWLLLNHVVPNTQIAYVGDYVRIVCALCNAFRPPRISATYENVLKAERMLALSKMPNVLQKLVEEKQWDRKRSVYENITHGNDKVLPDFPKLSLEELQDLTLGVYQLKQAYSYTNEHLANDELYKLSFVKEMPDIIRVLIQSRHVSSKQWSLWIKFTSGISPAFQWFCKCKAGARVVGCCAHVASVLWYLGYYRHLDKKIRVINSSGVNAINDAADRSGWTDSSSEDSTNDAEEY